MERSGTSTSSFGVSRRENHDSSTFYARFTAPEISSDATLGVTAELDRLICGDARDMSAIASNSVALVVTSPPYFAGKQYEEELGKDATPATYLEYLEMLTAVFRECVRVLEPGGRIAVNVANLGRRPFRSLAADVTSILQDELRLLLRGEIVWLKQRGASGSCAWGSFQQPTNPVLRDLTERVILASKGRFDRAISRKDRTRLGLPALSTMTREDFMEDTLDLWEIPPESATRVGHPAPFPVELPARLIELNTFIGDVVLDPFIGAGTTAIAALRLGRHYLGYDLDANYVALAGERIARELEIASTPRPDTHQQDHVRSTTEQTVVEMIAEGRSGVDITRELLRCAGFTVIGEQVKTQGNIRVAFKVSDCDGGEFYVDVAGGFTHARPGLTRPDVLWRTIGQASAIAHSDAVPLIVCTAGLPEAGSPQHRVLLSCTGPGGPIAHLVDMLSPSAAPLLRTLSKAQASTQS